MKKEQKNFVRNLRVPADATEGDIQNAIQRVFQKGQDRDIKTERERDRQSSVQDGQSDSQVRAQNVKTQNQNSDQ